MPEKRDSDSPENGRPKFPRSIQIRPLLYSLLTAFGITALSKTIIDYIIGLSPGGAFTAGHETAFEYSIYLALFIITAGIFLKYESKTSDKYNRTESEKRSLSHQNRRLYHAVQNSRDAVIGLDQDFKIVSINLAAELLTGWGMPYVENNPTETIINLADRNGKPVSLMKLLGENDNKTGPLEIISRSGKKTRVKQTNNPVVDRKGNTIGTILTFRDLSSGSNHLDAVEFAGIGIVKYTIDGTIKEIDDQSLRILDLEHRYSEPEEVVGRKLTELTVYTKSFRKVQREILRRGDIHGLEYSIITVRGKRKWLLHDSRIEIDRESGEKLIRMIIRDITLRKMTQFDLEEKTFYLEGILKSTARTAIIATDTIFRVKFFNRAASKIFGCSGDEVIGKSLLDLHQRDRIDPTGFDRAIEIVRMNGEYVYRIKRTIDDRPRQYEFTVRGLRRKNGMLAGYIIIAHEAPGLSFRKIELKRKQESLVEQTHEQSWDSAEVTKALL